MNIRLKLPNAKILYLKNFITPKKADQLYDFFLHNIPWKEDWVTVYGKTYKQPRLTSLHSTTPFTYKYSGLTLFPNAMTPELLLLLARLKKTSNHHFNAVLLNLYRNGNDSNGWHADNEKELGQNPVIASISLGATRNFHLKHRTNKDLRYTFPLDHGCLLMMEDQTQHYWLHQIAKTKKEVPPRINLTFRNIIE